MKLSIVAIKNHPDICGVVEYLENLDLVPAQYGDLDFAFPSEEYADRFDAPIEWYKFKRSNCVVVDPDTGMSAYVAYSKSADTIVALADVLSGTAEMPSPDEQTIALHILNLLEKNGYDRRNIDVVYTSDDEPEETQYQEMMDAMVPPAVAENMARDVLLQLIPDAEIPENFIPNMTFDGSQVSNINVPFKFAGKEFLCIFSREYKTTDKERLDSMTIQGIDCGDGVDLIIKDPVNARAEIVKDFFDFWKYTSELTAYENDLAEEFKVSSHSVGHDGTIKWKGTYQGCPLTIRCKDKEFSFSSPGLTGGGFTYEELEENLSNCIVPPEASGKEPECPFCSGKEVSFGSSQLTVKKEEGLAVVYDDEGVAANFKWKFCPECGRKL